MAQSALARGVQSAETAARLAENYGLDEPCAIEVPVFADGYTGESKVPDTG